MPLETLGPYKLEKVLGRGGMGAVYVGLNEETGERAAVKVLSAHLADDTGFRERFKQEIETLKRLLHPNIVQLFGYGEDDGHLFYVMEWVPGRSLQDELASGRRFTWREVARIGIAVAQALKHAHDRGIIHRDLKPANLLIDDQEHIKLTDFGIAKLYGGTSVTADGGVLGTADYMAPEQAEGKQITARCDLYSLGSVLYALLAGKPPFGGKTIIQVITALKNDQPVPIRRLAPSTPEAFEEIIAQLLEKDPQKRIPTALALANRLKAMEHALSLETKAHRIEPAADDGDELKLAPLDGSQGWSAEKTTLNPSPAATAPLTSRFSGDVHISGVLPTLVAEGTSAGRPASGSPKSSAPGSIAPGAPTLDIAATQATGAGGRSAPAPAAEGGLVEIPPEPEVKRPSFTRVSEAELRGHRGEDTSLVQYLAVGVLLLAGLVLAAAGVYYATRPASADQVYGRVREAFDEGGAVGLVEVEPSLADFLRRFPSDPRAQEVKGLEEELGLYRLERRFEMRSRRSGGEPLGPAERTYLAAIELEKTDPQGALAKLEALVNVYGGPNDEQLSALEQKTAQQCLELARKRIGRLQSSVAQMQADELAALEQQLERAAKLAESDRPGAEKIWRGIITLYSDQPWASELVEQARSALMESQTTEGSDGSHG
jgi:serine/threonine protein kinase